MGTSNLWRNLTFALAAATSVPPSVPAQPTIYFHEGSTRKVRQLTGDWDAAYGLPTLSQTNTRASLWATDLGSTFEHKGNLVFLFGDTWGGRDGALDTFGISRSLSPWDVLMDVPFSSDGKWIPIRPPGLAHYEFCIPSHGISVDGSMYAVYTQPDPDGQIMRRSFLIVSRDDGSTWQTLYELDNGDPANPVFINVWLERHDGIIYMFGSGSYRASSPTVARIPEWQFPTKSAWQYFSGRTLQGTPTWSTRAQDSAVLFNHNQLGEFSCSWAEPLSCWVMLYNSGSPRGITMRTAYQPTGPWSAPQIIMDPGREAAYGDYMHISWDVARRDLMSDPGRETEFGGEYGPYVISRFTTGTAEQCELYYTMSTWNPYAVVVMKSAVGTAPRPQLPHTQQQVLDNGRWRRFPANVADDYVRSGIPHITTFTNTDGDASRGWLWQKLPAGTQQVSFDIHGGHSEVFLLENFDGLPTSGDIDQVSALLRSGVYGRVVRRATGVNDNTTEIGWDWATTAYDTSSLGVVVLDAHNEPWGFVSLSQLTALPPMPPAGIVDWTMY